MIPLYLGPALEFFDAVSKGGVSQLARVRWHLGNDGWHDGAAWPPRMPMSLRLFLAHADRAGDDPEQGGGGLLIERTRVGDLSRALGPRPR